MKQFKNRAELYIALHEIRTKVVAEMGVIGFAVFSDEVTHECNRRFRELYPDYDLDHLTEDGSEYDRAAFDI